MRYGRATLLLALVLAAAWVIESARPTAAMPPFAQSYGVDCSTCHTVVPGLNAYGRYVQRTGYASLDPATIHRANPIWLAENPTYDSASPSIVWGNVAVHAAGYVGTDFTFHAHYWVTQSNGGGFVDTLWVTYNNLLHRDGHLFLGKVEAPAPSPYSQWFELQGFAPTSLSVGEHSVPWGNNGWGTKLAYVISSPKPLSGLTAEVAYLGNPGDLNTATDWNPLDTEKRFQWRVIDSLGYHPVEWGFYGGHGVAPVSNGFDHYTGNAVYAQLDSQRGLPGALVIYQGEYDDNPGTGFMPAHSKALSAEIYEPVFSNVILSARNEFTDDGLGTISHSTNIDLAAMAIHSITDRQAQGLIINAEAVLIPGSTPEWKGQLWYVTTIAPLRH